MIFFIIVGFLMTWLVRTKRGGRSGGIFVKLEHILE
jgi:peptidoglycan/LPS O-acetylase OafA/YrhL